MIDAVWLVPSFLFFLPSFLFHSLHIWRERKGGRKKNIYKGPSYIRFYPRKSTPLLRIQRSTTYIYKYIQRGVARVTANSLAPLTQRIVDFRGWRGTQWVCALLFFFSCLWITPSLLVLKGPPCCIVRAAAAFFFRERVVMYLQPSRWINTRCHRLQRRLESALRITKWPIRIFAQLSFFYFFFQFICLIILSTRTRYRYISSRISPPSALISSASMISNDFLRLNFRVTATPTWAMISHPATWRQQTQHKHTSASPPVIIIWRANKSRDQERPR